MGTRCRMTTELEALGRSHVAFVVVVFFLWNSHRQIEPLCAPNSRVSYLRKVLAIRQWIERVGVSVRIHDEILNSVQQGRHPNVLTFARQIWNAQRNALLDVTQMKIEAVANFLRINVTCTTEWAGALWGKLGEELCLWTWIYSRYLHAVRMAICQCKHRSISPLLAQQWRNLLRSCSRHFLL